MSGHIVTTCLPGKAIPNPTGGIPTGVITDPDGILGIPPLYFTYSPDPSKPPVTIGTGADCKSGSYVACFYARYRLTIKGDVQLDWNQFVLLMMAVYFDIKQRDRTNLDRIVYDTPFWDGGDPQGRVCFGDACFGSAEVNYFAQGMWSAANGESMVISEIMVVDNWKHLNWALGPIRGNQGTYAFWPSQSTIDWFEIGYNAYKNFDNNSQYLYNMFEP